MSATETDGSLTLDELKGKIESDASFAKKFTDGVLDGTISLENADETENAAAKEPEQKVETPPAKTPEPVTPAPGSENLQRDQEVEKTFVVRKSQLGRYKNANELIKSHGEQVKYIDKLKREKAEADERARTLESKVKEFEQLKASSKPADDPEAIEFDSIDPERTKKLMLEIEELKSKVPKVETLEQELNRLKAEREAEINERKRQKSMEATYSALKGIQSEIGLATDVPLESIDSDWAKFIRDLGDVAGTDGSYEQNMKVYETFVGGVGDDAEELRSLALANSLSLPKELDKYAAIQEVHQEYERLKAQYPNIGIKTVINFLKESGKLEGFEFFKEEPKAPKEKYDRDKIERAVKARMEAAASIPAGMSGSDAIGNLSVDEKIALLQTPDKELKKNPAKKKMVDEILKSMGMSIR